MLDRLPDLREDAAESVQIVGRWDVGRCPLPLGLIIGRCRARNPSMASYDDHRPFSRCSPRRRRRKKGHAWSDWHPEFGVCSPVTLLLAHHPACSFTILHASCRVVLIGVRRLRRQSASELEDERGACPTTRADVERHAANAVVHVTQRRC